GGWVSGRARASPGLSAIVSWVGGAVKAGPLGPPGGEALTAPGFQLSPATIGSGPLRRSLVAVLWLDTADLHHCAHAELGDRDARRPAISSRWFAWCVPATARRAHS